MPAEPLDAFFYDSIVAFARLIICYYWLEFPLLSTDEFGAKELVPEVFGFSAMLARRT